WLVHLLITEFCGHLWLRLPTPHFSLKCAKKSKQKKAHPGIRVSLRETSLLPALLRGRVTMGHPWPSVTRSASMPRVPLRSASTRPPDGDLSAPDAPSAKAQSPKPKKACRVAARGWAGTRVPSGGRAESSWKGPAGQAERHG